MSPSRPLWRIGRSLLLAGEASDSVSILIFHRVMAEKDPLRPGEPDTEEFDRIVRFLTRNFHVVPLHDALFDRPGGSHPGHRVAITFDDGYADNFELALPILRRHGAAATFFVSSAYLDGGIMWNDVIIESIRVHQDNDLDTGEIGLGVHDTSGMDRRRDTIGALISALKYRPDAERHEYASRIATLCDATLPHDLMLTSAQLRSLAEDEYAEIGGHTISHPILSRIDPDAAHREIAGGKSELEGILGAEIRAFAYPNGIPGVDYGAEHVEMVREAGFELAVSTSHGGARRGADLYQLPRFTPWDRQMPAFGLRLLLAARSRGERVDRGAA